MNGIKKNRTTARITQVKLSELLGIDKSTVAKWETGESKPRADTLMKLAKIFDCSVDELLEEDAQKAS